MAYAAQLLFPHGADLRCVRWRHQSNQIPHHLSSSKCVLFLPVLFSKLSQKLIVNVYSGVSNQATGCSVRVNNNPALCVFHASAACTLWSLLVKWWRSELGWFRLSHHKCLSIVRLCLFLFFLLRRSGGHGAANIVDVLADKRFSGQWNFIQICCTYHIPFHKWCPVCALEMQRDCWLHLPS